jgi:DNA-binding beta-propeller fold protein YncE
VPLAKGENLTSIAVHPDGGFLAAVIELGDPAAPGRVELRATADGALIKALPVGVGPDAGVFSADGRWLVVADEAEEFTFDAATRTFRSAPGGVTRIDLGQGPAAATALTLTLPDLGALPGAVDASQGRMLERNVDVNGDGKATAPADLNRDGDIDDEKVAVGRFGGVTVYGDEAQGELFHLPISGASADLLEPEHLAISPDGTRAYLTLQESNAVAVIDLVAGRFERAFGLGIVEHPTDATDDNQAVFTGTLRALREPDGTALTPDGRFLVTADEGDTEPRISQVAAGTVVGGGRTISVFDAATGKLVGDSGNGLDEATARRGFYPDSRSGAKGSEPEMVVVATIDDVPYAIVSLERANGIAVVSLADPAAPKVVGVGCADRTAKAGAVGPEGIAYYAAGGRHYALTANEKDGSLSVYLLTP